MTLNSHEHSKLHDSSSELSDIRPLKVDLHCHSTASDGSLPPSDVLQRAREQGVSLLALTDHDTTRGVRELLDKGIPEDIRLLPGIELSTRWGTKEIHIVGLGFNIKAPLLESVERLQASSRQRRAEHIAGKLGRRMKIPAETVLQETMVFSGGNPPVRPHFADWLIEKGAVTEREQAFRRYIGANKVGNLSKFWPYMSQAVKWIKEMGGIAVLAHPGKYRVSPSQLRAIIKDFAEAGGEAMEVTGGMQPPGQAEQMARLADEFGLMASCGSDFHHPDSSWIELGKVGKLPEGCQPVWMDERISKEG
ncbi:PHP domain-containing protein [Endozoicomonadaceae bacterium StTr2]